MDIIFGRFEAGDSTATESGKSRTAASDTSGELVIKSNQEIYRYITKSNAIMKSQNMYNSNNFKSDLMNSFAWDTAVLFIQTFGKNSNYANLIGRAYDAGIEKATGTNILHSTKALDVECNIYDMAGNLREWSTEHLSSISSKVGGITRGSDAASSTGMVKTRSSITSDYLYEDIGFRPIIYIKATSDNN